MMKAVEYSKRKGFNYQKCAGVFRRLQHEANEGTHAGHFQKLAEVYNFYTKTAWQTGQGVLYYNNNERKKH